MEVLHKDRKKEVEYLRMALSICEIGVSYTQAELILKATEELKIKKGIFTLEDGISLLYTHKNQWNKYFETLNKKEK